MPPHSTPVRRYVERDWEESLAWLLILVAAVALLRYLFVPTPYTAVVLLASAAAGLMTLGLTLLREQRDMHRETRERLEQLSDRLDRLDAEGPGTA